jgi:hypothetical protein
MIVNVGTIIIIFIAILIIFKSYKNKEERTNYKTTCFIDKITAYFSYIYNFWHPNNILNVDHIKDYGLIINSEFKHLYILEINDFKDLDDELIYKLFKTFSLDRKAFFYQAILKNESYQKQYIFSYSKELIEMISEKIGAKVLSGKKSLKVLKKIVFIDENKEKLNINQSIRKAKKQLSSQFEVYQGYKSKDGHIDDVYQKLQESLITGVIWGYYDFYQGRIDGYISNKLKNHEFFIGPKELVIVNFILISKNITKKQINQISDIYNISLVKKSINSAEMILKTPLKNRDVEWDLLVNLDYLSNQFIAKG